MDQTDAQGQYGFVNLQLGYDYTVTPSLDERPLNGVSTYDLVLITKHILGVQPLNTPYKLIAADVNNSKSISILDLIALRKLILSVDTEFANNTSWRFVEASYAFPNPVNPWSQAFPEVKNINDLAGQINNVNFVAIKIGDIDGNARLSANATEVRNINGAFHFQVADAALVAGNEYRVDFTAADIASIQGYQATLTLDTKVAQLVDIAPGVATTENFGLRYASQGIITTSWNGEAQADQVLFTLIIRAKADANLSQVLGISSRYTVAEAYNQASELMNVGIQFNSGAVTAVGFELYQNTPNPFKGQTVIGFNLPTAGDATISISDVTGKVVKLVRGNYAKGYNNVILQSTDLPTGVLTYTLQAGQFTDTKKMVILQ
ncbi:T9SS type A sorting domain-containing protein [bacterium]|nr:T9SS type A sorting domain-containing protein [bacterium]